MTRHWLKVRLQGRLTFFGTILSYHIEDRHLKLWSIKYDDLDGEEEEVTAYELPQRQHRICT